MVAVIAAVVAVTATVAALLVALLDLGRAAPFRPGSRPSVVLARLPLRGLGGHGWTRHGLRGRYGGDGHRRDRTVHDHPPRKPPGRAACDRPLMRDGADGDGHGRLNGWCLPSLARFGPGPAGSGQRKGEGAVDPAGGGDSRGHLRSRRQRAHSSRKHEQRQSDRQYGESGGKQVAGRERRLHLVRPTVHARTRAGVRLQGSGGYETLLAIPQETLVKLANDSRRTASARMVPRCGFSLSEPAGWAAQSPRSRAVVGSSSG